MAKAKTNPLDGFFDAWDRTTGGGRDDAAARTICDAYVRANPADFAEFEEWTRDECVASVDVLRSAAEQFRSKGLERQARTADENKLKVDVWLLHRFEPQQIGGTAEAKVRIPSDG